MTAKEEWKATGLDRIIRAYKQSDKLQNMSIWAAEPYKQAKKINDLINRNLLGDALDEFGSHFITDGMDASYSEEYPELLAEHIEAHRQAFSEYTSWPEDRIYFPSEYNLSGIQVYGNSVIPYTAFRLGYYAYRISNLQLPTKPVILEIGGGWGGLAHIILNNIDAHYVIVDIPTTLTVSSHFLGSTGRDVCLYGEHDDLWETIMTHDCTLIPHFAIEEVPFMSCDVVINTASLIEMHPNSIEFYMKHINRITRGYFYSDNSNGRKKKRGALDKYMSYLEDFEMRINQKTPINVTLPRLHPDSKIRRISFLEQLFARKIKK